MSSFIKYSLYEGSQELEETRLRSILLFNGKLVKPKRQDLMAKAILSIIIAEQGKATKTSLITQIGIQFHLSFSENQLDDYLKKLHNMGLLESLAEPFVAKDSGRDGDFFQRLESDTNAFIEGIIEECKSIVGGQISAPDPLKETIRKALSVYYGMYAYSFFDVQEKGSIDNQNSAVNIIKQEVKEQKLANALIVVLAKVIDQPDEQQSKVLTQWARAFVAMQAMAIDPMLINLSQKNLRNKEFIIDTDIALYALTTSAKYSVDYKNMISKLKDLGCKMYLFPDVISEVENHASASVKVAHFYGNRLFELSEDLINKEISNIFIEDYVLSERSKEDRLLFRQYIENIYDPDYSSLLENNLTKVFTDKALVKSPSIPRDSSEFLALENKVFDLTLRTPKGKKRTEEENHKVSYLDTLLYLTAVEKNEGLDTSSLLSGKTYLLTDSSRAQRAAKFLGWQIKNVVCHPNALIAVLMDVGSINDDKRGIINLFDNPFLSYVADTMWEKIYPFLDQGAEIKSKKLERLRLDVEKRFDAMLVSSNPQDRREKVAEWGIYLPDYVDAVKTESTEQRRRIEELEKENASLRNSLALARSTKAKPNSKKNVSNRTKKKRNP